MSTKPDTDTGWSKADLVSRAAVNKILYDGYQNHLHDCTNSVRAAEFVHGLQKAVTALPPSDFEQLIQLRAWKESAMTLLSRYDSIADTFGGKLGSSKIDNLERGVERQRKAATLCAIPYEALLMDRESRKWIAPEVWTAIENAVAALREALAHKGEQS